MSRFNIKSKDQHLNFNAVNYEGEKAHSLNPEMELYSLVCTSALQNQFYRTCNDSIERLKELLQIVDVGFSKKLAIYAREQMYLRSIPLVIAVLLAKIEKCDKKFVSRIIQRADELSELLAVYSYFNESNIKGAKKISKLPVAIKKGIAGAFSKFDEYQFAKYKKDDKEISLRDAMFLTHPKPENKEREELYRKIATQDLEIPYTWEAKISGAAAKDKTKKQVWQELIDSNKLGYMALMRNLRNLLKEEISAGHINVVVDKLSKKENVKKSKQLPFRFLSAYRELVDFGSPDVHLFLKALEEAIMHSTDNIPGFNNQTLLIAADVSGSMGQSISDKSKIQLFDIGLLLSMLLQSKTRCYTGIFGDIFKIKQLPKDNVLSNVIKLWQIEGEVGYSTNGYKVIDWLINNNKIVDKIMIFTDCQLWDSNDSDAMEEPVSMYIHPAPYKGVKFRHTYDEHIARPWIKYKTINPKAKLYLFDLAGYGNSPLQINEKDVFLIAGWSDKIFDVLAALENGDNALNKIKEIKI